MNHIESYWIILNHFESFWILLNRFESFWIVLNHFDLYQSFWINFFFSTCLGIGSNSSCRSLQSRSPRSDKNVRCRTPKHQLCFSDFTHNSGHFASKNQTYWTRLWQCWFKWSYTIWHFNLWIHFLNKKYLNFRAKNGSSLN